MRPLPPEQAAQVRPMPADFAPVVSIITRKRDSYSRWADTIRVEGHPPFKAELGFPRSPHDEAANSARAELLRAEIWQVLEYARLGRFDLLAHVNVDRHKGARIVSAPLIPPPDELAKA